MSQHKTLLELIQKRSLSESKGVTFIEGSNEEEFVSYKEIYHSALHVLANFRAKGLKKGDELLFQIEDNKTFIIVFWACICGGIIPVPVSVAQKPEHRFKLFNIWQVLNRPYLIISGKNFEQINKIAHAASKEAFYNDMKEHHIDLDHIFNDQQHAICESISEDDIAFIQFSSGSTGSPKGVTLTHKNLITNIDAIGCAARYTPNDSTISWMPLTHDMGLIGFHLNPVHNNMNQYLIPTNVFVRRPAIWMDKATKYNVSILCSPNFGYKYLIKHASEKDMENWDLSKVRVLYNGAEPISVNICYEFIGTMQKSGLKKGVMRPVYGLAEASLAVTISELGADIITYEIKRSSLNFGNKIELSQPDEDTVTFVNVGTAINDVSLRITDNENNVVPDYVIGHIQIKGDNVTSGYYNNSEATSATITKDKWLKTGDLGFMVNGALCITGRAKDIIFVNGQNYYPHDIEQACFEVEGAELNKIAVAGYFDEKTQEEKTIAFVYYKGKKEKFIPLIGKIQSVVNRVIGFELSTILPVRSIPKTTSGKLQRFKLLQQYKNGDFDAVEKEISTLLSEAEKSQIKKPQNEIEKELLAIWQNVLGIDHISTDWNFFEAGGNSLKAAELSNGITSRFKVELTSLKLFENQTIEALAQIIPHLDKKEDVRFPVTAKQDKYPASQMQNGFYYAWKLNPDATAYNMPGAYLLKGQLDLNALERAFTILLEKNRILSSSFIVEDELVMKFNPLTKFKLEVVKNNFSEDELSAYLQSQIKPFNLHEGPLYRVSLLEIAKDKHILFTDFHHIVSDGISQYSLLSDLINYHNGESGQPESLTYGDFAIWEKKVLQEGNLEKSRSFWAEKFKELPEALDLPADYKRPEIFNTTGKKVRFSVANDVIDCLKGIATETKTTMHQVLFTAYSIFLKRHSGQRKAVIAIPVANRNHSDLLAVHGPFVNNLPLLTTVNENLSFKEMLLQNSRLITEAMAHQSYPFFHLIKSMSVQRDMSRNPLFDTMFVYQNMGGLPQTTALAVERYFIPTEVSKFDLSLEIFEATSFDFAFEYATSLFKDETVAGFIKSFKNLLAEIARSPEEQISNCNILGEEDRRAFIYEFNNTEIKLPSVTSVLELFLENVSKKPEAPALNFKDQVLTYSDLDRKSSVLQKILIDNGVCKGDHVALYLNRSPEFIISMLAVLKAGAAYVPIDMNTPVGRIKYIVQHSNSKLIVCSDKSFQLIEGISGNSKLLSITSLPLNEDYSYDLTNIDNAGQTAYIIYTSGTTGNPKGVMIAHSSLLNYAFWAAENYLPEGNSSFAFCTSVSFDLTITSLFVPLISGNVIDIYEDNGEEIPVHKVLADNQSSVIKLTPSHLKIISDIQLPETPELKTIIVGGEVLETGLANTIYKKFNGKVSIFNEYGPTEATVGCAIYKYNPDSDTGYAVPIGKPAGNTQLYILDDHFNPVGFGVKGELYISGNGLAKGYYSNETLTNEKFINHPFKEGEKMYKTGDEARRLFSGALDFLGRKDRQIKLNGYRIELLEIENALRKIECIKDAVATIRNTSNETSLIYAYYIKEEVANTNNAGIRKDLAGELPHYMIPAHLIEIEKIPLTTNGKVDFSALPDEVGSKEITAAEKMLNGRHRILLEIWKEVLEKDTVSVTDNFFELGGDSIKAVQIVSKAFQKGISLEIKDILTYHTIDNIVEICLDSVTDNQNENNLPAKGDKPFFPVDLWFVEQNFETPGYFHQSVLLEMKQPVKRDILIETFNYLISYHDALRLNLSKDNKLFFNSEHLGRPVVLNEISISSGQSFEVLEEYKANWSLQNDLLIKVVLCKKEGYADHLLVVMHHLLTDGISWRIFLEDFTRIYKQLAAGESVDVLPKTDSLQKWGDTLTGLALSRKVKDQANYWNAIDKTDFSISADMDTSDWSNANKATGKVVLNSEETDFITQLAASTYKTDAQTILLTALASVLRNRTGYDNPVIELENHGRHLDNLNVSRTMGWFTVMYPFVLRNAGKSVGDQLKTIKEDLNKVPDNGIGYGICRYIDKSLKSKSIPEVRFNYLGDFSNSLENDIFRWSDNKSGHDSAPDNHLTAKLEINLMIIDKELVIEVGYNSKAFKKETIANFLTEFKNEVKMIISYLREEDEIYLTPSDFDLEEIDQEELDALFK